jgi:Ni,Fe-hydrogenase III large subunit
MGFVGMVAKSCGINRDVRFTHPHGLYKTIKLQPTILQSGDVHARAYLRYQEVLRSIEFIREILQTIPSKISKKDLSDAPLESQSLAISLTEGWRGEICHVALTDKNGKIAAYRIKDPSIHNWFALALAVRNNEISDFPLCNKSFNLSYCGHDL